MLQYRRSGWITPLVAHRVGEWYIIFYNRITNLWNLFYNIFIYCTNKILAEKNVSQICCPKLFETFLWCVTTARGNGWQPSPSTLRPVSSDRIDEATICDCSLLSKENAQERRRHAADSRLVDSKNRNDRFDTSRIAMALFDRIWIASQSGNFLHCLKVNFTPKKSDKIIGRLL